MTAFVFVAKKGIGMMKRFALIALLLGLASITNVKAEIREHAFRWTNANPSGHPLVRGGAKFSELVAEKSGGKMVVKLYTGGVLGGDLQVLSSLQTGTIDFASMNSGILQSLVKEFAIFDFPFLFNDAQEAYALMDGPIGKKLADKLPGKGLVNLAYYELGFRHLTNSKRPVKTAEDIQGLKIRVVQSPTYIDTFNALGANAVPMSITEVYSGLDKKAIDGQENPFSVIAINKFDVVQKYMTLTRHMYNPQSFLMSKKVWDKLNADEQQVIASAAKESAVFQRKASRDAQERSLANLRKTMEVYELPADEVVKIRAKLKPVIEKFSASVGADFAKSVFAEIEKTRK